MPSLATVASEPAQAVVARPRVTVLYASQTGNSRRVAEKLGQAFAAAGVEQRVLASGDYTLRHLAEERFLYVVASTHGDGEPPDDARALEGMRRLTR